MEKKINRFIYWTPRILSILFLLFLAMFSLDVFDEKLGFWETVLGLFMHNIPVFVLSIFLVVAWKREWIGAIAFMLGGLLYTGVVLTNVFRTGFEWYYLAWIAQISGIAFLIGILFIVNWLKKRNNRNDVSAG